MIIMVAINRLSYKYAEVDDNIYNKDFLLVNNGLIDMRINKESFSLAEIEYYILKYDPAILIIGNGLIENKSENSSLRKKLEKLGIKVYVEETRTAAKIFNKYAEKEVKVLGLFRITG